MIKKIKLGINFKITKGGFFMSDLPEMLKKLKYDKRMLNWNLRQKLLTKEEYDKYLKSLEDLSHLKAENKYEEENKGESK